MSRTEKLLKRLLANPADFHWNELVSILKTFGYTEAPAGKTGGSRRRFTHTHKPPLTFHKPHPKGILKAYQIRQTIDTLKEEGFL